MTADEGCWAVVQNVGDYYETQAVRAIFQTEEAADHDVDMRGHYSFYTKFLPYGMDIENA